MDHEKGFWGVRNDKQRAEECLMIKYTFDIGLATFSRISSKYTLHYRVGWCLRGSKKNEQPCHQGARNHKEDKLN